MYAEDIVQCCGLCIFSEKKNANDEENYICEKKGNVKYNENCKNFHYDIFKKKVRRKPKVKFKEYKPEDFNI